MLCKNCGTEFEGNFCSNCGAPALSCVDGTEYPPAPVGEYKGSLCTVILSEDAITIRKKILFNKSEETILYSDLCNISFKKGVLGGFICVRSLKNRSKPMSTGGTSASDPFSADFTAATESEKFYAIYEFLQTVVEINDYPIYEPLEKKDIPSFKQWKHEPAYQSEHQYNPEPVQRVVLEHQYNPEPVQRVVLEHQYNPEPVQRVVLEREKPHKKSKRELKIQAHNSGQACCPRCGFVSLSANKKGFGIVKGGLGALAGGFLTGGVGAVVGAGAGNINAKKVWVTCLNCGKRWKM